MAKVRQMKNGFDYSREKIVEPEWLFQAYFAGIKQLRLAHFNEKALVTQPIETIQISDLYKVNISSVFVLCKSQKSHNYSTIAETWI